MLSKILTFNGFRNCTNHMKITFRTKKYVNLCGLEYQIANKNQKHFEYLPIVDMSEDGQKRHNRQVLYDTIKAMPTVDEKLLELCIRQLLKLNKYVLEPVPKRYNGIFFHQFITRTHLIEELPKNLGAMNVDRELSEIKNSLNDTLLHHYSNKWQSEYKDLNSVLNEKDSGAHLVNQMISLCYKKLSLRNEYIWESTIQHNPWIESCWWHQGFESKEELLEEKNLCFRFKDVPALIIRTKKPLNPILDLDDPVCATAEVPDCQYHPSTFNFETDDGYLKFVPGCWPEDPCGFPFLVVKTRGQINELLKNIERYDLKKIENAVGMLSMFGTLNSFAANQGFTPFHDVTYPLTTQMILTNGQDFTFFVYQLNTLAFHSDVDTRDLRNICWTSGKMRLFDTIEDGVVKGVNDAVYRILLQFLLNAPTPSDHLVLKPYLGVDVRSEEEVNCSRYLLRRLFSQKPDHNAHEDEIPTWVQIYKLHPDAPPSPYIKLF